MLKVKSVTIIFAILLISMFGGGLSQAAALRSGTPTTHANIAALGSPNSVNFSKTSQPMILNTRSAGSNNPPSGIADLPPTGSSVKPPQTVVGGGGYSYPSSSPYYVYQNWAGSNNADVPYRQGNSNFGLIHVLNRHDTATSIVGATVQYGKWKLEQPGNASSAWLYYAWFYNPELPTYDADRYVTIKVIVNSTTIMKDGLSKGIITAYALNYPGMVPSWIANPNVYDCAFGGSGMAP